MPSVLLIVLPVSKCIISCSKIVVCSIQSWCFCAVTCCSIQLLRGLFAQFAIPRSSGITIVLYNRKKISRFPFLVNSPYHIMVYSVNANYVYIRIAAVIVESSSKACAWWIVNKRWGCRLLSWKKEEQLVEEKSKANNCTWLGGGYGAIERLIGYAWLKLD